jgi:hypothetical protein
MKFIFLLAVGLVAGYLFGFNDAQHHTEPLQRRVAGQIASRAGGASRDRVGNNIDAKMDRERP